MPAVVDPTLVMRFAIVMVMLMIMIHCDVKDLSNCGQIDMCSCNLTGEEQSRMIDLYSVVNGRQEPTFVTKVGYYNYSYNPCLTCAFVPMLLYVRQLIEMKCMTW